MKTYLNLEDINELEEAANNLRDKLLIRLLYYSACRISEALALAVKDIDFKQGIIIIKHLKDRIKLSCPDCGTRLSKANTYCPGCAQKVNKVIKENPAKIETAKLRKIVTL